MPNEQSKGMPLQHMAKETEMQTEIFAEMDSKHGDMVYNKDVFATPCCLIASCIVWILPSIPTMEINGVLTNDLVIEMMHAFVSACCVFAGVLSGFHLTPIFCCALTSALTYSMVAMFGTSCAFLISVFRS